MRKQETPGFIVGNEFAAVEVSLDQDGQDCRLCLRDLETGAVTKLDAVSLSALTCITEETLRLLVWQTLPE